LAYSDKGEYDRAIADLDRVISLDPFNATAYFNRGITYIQKGESARAIQDFDSAITLNPNSANYYVNRSIAMFNTGNLAGALEDCDTALRLDPNNAEAYGRRGDVRFETGDYALAIQDYDQSLLIDPGPVAFYAYRGQAHFILGNFAAASGDFAVMVERDPTDGYAVLLRSIAGRRGGEDVVRIFEADAARVDLATWPGPIVKYFLGDLSMEDLRQVAETTPADGIDKICEYDLYVGLGALLFKDNHAAARPLFEQAELDCQPNSMADRFAKAELARMPQ
jgi:tetratricopeptide (TPR) repeat protein